MDHDFWKQRWERGETGWHQSEVEPELKKGFSKLEPTRVFVPLCGMSLDMKWLASKDHEVVGVELSELACRSFFEKNRIPFETARAGKFVAYLGGGITIFNGDFFDLDSTQLGEVGAVYDRGALIALPPDLRQKYVDHMTRLLRDVAVGDFKFLQIVLERASSEEGPPFSVTENDLRSLYGQSFEITPVSREQVVLGGEPPENVEQCVYTLTPLWQTRSPEE